jgi:hypothetical protein
VWECIVHAEAQQANDKPLLLLSHKQVLWVQFNTISHTTSTLASHKLPQISITPLT